MYSRISVSSPKKPGCRHKAALGASPAVSPPRGMPWGSCPLPGLLRLGSTDLKHHKVWSREKNPRSRAGMCPVQRLLCAAASTVPEHGAAGTFVHQRHGHSRAKKIEFCFFFFCTCTASDSHSPASNRANVLVSPVLEFAPDTPHPAEEKEVEARGETLSLAFIAPPGDAPGVGCAGQVGEQCQVPADPWHFFSKALLATESSS